MDKAGIKTRDIRFFSGKNNQIICIHSKWARDYAKHLEQQPWVQSYQAVVPLEPDYMQYVSPVDIRSLYFQSEWATDFLIMFADGRKGVRELVHRADLTKRAMVERLELSRRYWAARDIDEWKVVLVDEASASASEILTGALQDWDRAVVVGRRTFGKGLVQMPLPMPDGSMITLTVSRYYTPTGRCIQKPYQKGNAEEYEHDLIDRYNRGELLSADSIHFPDSLKYSTLVSGRTVYGGGGIMPDVFIPLDTTRLTDYHRELLAAGCINRVAMNYLDRNREKLTSLYDKKHFSKYKSEFYVEDDTMDELVELGKNDSIPFNEEEFRRSEQLMRLQIKALIARDLFDMSEYYQVINDINDSLIEALSIINDEKRYQSILKN